jgi:hypothetical protein
MTFDWSKFETRIAIHADPQVLYNAWSSQEGIEHWFLRLSEYTTADGRLRGSDEEVEVGDTYLWRWHGWDDETQERGKILACNGRDHFQFSFGEAGICTVDILQENGYTVVSLTQTQIPTDEKGMHYYHVGCKTGWTFHLTNMKSIFEGGADLRNKDVALRNVINA